jgi:hypothetical protein
MSKVIGGGNELPLTAVTRCIPHFRVILDTEFAESTPDLFRSFGEKVHMTANRANQGMHHEERNVLAGIESVMTAQRAGESGFVGAVALGLHGFFGRLDGALERSKSRSHI